MDDLKALAADIAHQEERLAALRQERNDLMASLHDSGVSVYALARASGLSWEGASKIIAAYGPTPPGRH